MTTILAFDTATNACTVALLHQGIAYERFDIAPQQHTALLLPMIAELLAAQNLSRADIDVIAFGRGPGSFMGTRLATGIAHGLGYALDKPLVPVSTLQIIAQTAYDMHGVEHVVAAWDARMGEMYWGIYQLQDGIMRSVVPDALSAPAELLDLPKEAALVGNAWSVYGIDSAYSDCYPRASALLTIANHEAGLGRLQSAFSVEPIYIRDKVC